MRFSPVSLALLSVGVAWGLAEEKDAGLRGSLALEASGSAKEGDLSRKLKGKKKKKKQEKDDKSPSKKGHFNYDPNDKEYGPEAWEYFSDNDVKYFPDYKYWDKYEKYLKKELGKKGMNHNYCGEKEYHEDQAPIDLNIKDINYECYEYHQLREKRGDYQLDDPDVEMQIRQNSLRIVYPGKLDSEGKNPTADIPYKWGDQFPVIHADLIMKSAHTIDGKQYPAEYQVWVLSTRDRGRGAAVISSVIDIGAHNEHLQKAIDGWQKIFDNDRKPGGQRERELNDKETERGLGKRKSGWNPFHSSLLPSFYWWGYEGTTMEPPCYPITEYRITDMPAEMSSEQLEQLQKLLFDHCVYDDKTGTCEPTSNHYNHSVARPIQATAGRDLHRCSCVDFYPDEKRKNCDLEPGALKKNGKKKRCPRDCRADSTHKLYKQECPDWWGGSCPEWYEG